MRGDAHASALSTPRKQCGPAAGLTKGAVYARFAGMADLLLALLAQRIEQRLAELRALPARRSPVEALDGILLQWLERSRDAAWNLLVVEFRVVAPNDGESAQRARMKPAGPGTGSTARPKARFDSAAMPT